MQRGTPFTAEQSPPFQQPPSQVTARPRMSSIFLPTPLSSISFEDKFHFSTRQSLPYVTRRCCSPPKRDTRVDIWNIKAPDLSIRLYRSISPKNERRVRPRPPAEDEKRKRPKVLPERESRTETPRFRTSYRPAGADEAERRTETRRFRTSYRPAGAVEAEMLFVKTGKYPKETYKNPTAHNFRALDEAASHFITAHDKDPGNLKLQLSAVDTNARVTVSSPPSSDKHRKSKLDTFKHAEPQWDARLLLPVGPWPPKSASYTRHKRRRGAYSAFLERVEEKLTRSWRKS